MNISTHNINGTFMNKVKLLLLLSFAALTASCSSTTVNVNFDQNKDIDTTNYKTFAWLTENKTMSETIGINTVMKVRVDDSIEQAFIAKGYQLINDAETADFAISYTIGSREKISVNSYPSSYRRSPGWGRSYYGSETSVRKYNEGKLAIDVFDVKTHQPVFHGWATKRIPSQEMDAPLTEINSIVSQVVNQFN